MSFTQPVGLLAPISSIPSPIPRDGLIGEWLFNGNANDTSGEENDPTLIVNDVYTNDRDGNTNAALNCAAGNVRIDLPLAPFNWQNGSFSVWMWIKTSSNVSDDIETPFWQLGSGNSTAIVIYQNSGDFRVYVRDQGGGGIANQLVGATLAANTYYFIGLQRDQGAFGRVDFFLNNVSIYNAISSGTLNPNGTANIASQSSGANFFKGVVDNTRIYNRVLTPAEITALYNE